MSAKNSITAHIRPQAPRKTICARPAAQRARRLARAGNEILALNPGGKMSQDEESDLQPPSDDSDRIKDFFSRHGGPGQQPRRSGRSQGGLKGWSEIDARDGHVLRCDWSRSGTLEEMKYSEVAPPLTSQ
jgi:hypothetical protein